MDTTTTTTTNADAAAQEQVDVPVKTSSVSKYKTAAAAAAEDKSPPQTDTLSVVIVPQLEAHGVTYGELQTAIKVLNAIATLNPKSTKKRKTPPKTTATDDNEGSTAASNSQQKKEEDESCSIAQYKQPNLRPFRKALASCLDLHQRTMFQGVSEDDHYDQRKQDRSQKRQKMADKDMYKKHIALTALRKGRVDRLQAAMGEGACEEKDKLKLMAIQAMMVPDGHVDTTTTTDAAQNQHPLLLENNENGEEAAEAATTVKLPCLRSCYVCKVRYRDLHSFYDQLCPACADINWAKRMQTADMKGRVAVVTGSRVKIGYQVCLKLLRAGATVVATTRFPNAAVDSYRQEADFVRWSGNLHVYGLDLRDVAGLEAFTRFLKQKFATTGGIDALINNACQTIRRPAGYYKPAIEKEQHLWSTADATHKERLSSCIEFERLRRRIVLDHKEQQQHANGEGNSSVAGTSPQLLPSPIIAATTASDISAHESSSSGKAMISAPSIDNGGFGDRNVSEQTTLSGLATAASAAPFETTGLSHSAAMSQMIILPEDAGVNDEILPPGVSDINGQQLDLRSTNSWLLKMEEVSTPELMECMFVNAIAPFVLNARLKPLMTLPNDDSRPDRYIINVSAMEGKVRIHLQ